MSNYKQSIAEQLTALGRAVPSLSEEELRTGILDTCSGLVTVLSGSLRNTKLDANSLSDLVSCLEGLQAQLNKLASAATCADCLQVKGEAVEQLSELQVKMQDLQTRERKAKTQLPALQQQIQQLEPTVTKLEADFKMQENFRTGLLNKAETYSEENRKALEAENNRLLEQITAARTKFEKLETQKNEHQKEMTNLQNKIDAMPTQQQLVADYDRKVAELERLKKAEVECSLAKQSELDNQIADLHKDVKGLEAAMEKLRAREQDVLSAKTSLETEKGIFETEFIGKLQEAMDDLKNNMSAHKKALNQLKDDAEMLKKSIDECNSIRLNYSFMFDSLNDPLEAIARVTEMDHEALKKYLDVNMSNRIDELKGNIKRDLDQLGTIIDQCREASSTDQQRLHYKIFEAK